MQQQPVVANSKQINASIVPLLIGAVSTLISVVLLPRTLSEHSSLYGSVGVFFALVVVGMAYAFDTVSQRKGIMTSPWFTQKPLYTNLLRILLVVGLVIALINIYVIADVLSEYFGEMLYDVL